MKMLKTVRLVLAIAGVVMAGGWACAQGPGGPGMGPGFGQHRPPMERAFGFANGQFWNNPDVVKQLILTDDQRKAMDGILQDHRMKLIDMQATLRKAEVEMIPLMKADTPDRAAIEAQIDKVVSARADLEKANAHFLLDIRMQLKPDQWKQLQTVHQDRMHHEGMGERGRGQWGHDGRGPGMGRPRQPVPWPRWAVPQAAGAATTGWCSSSNAGSNSGTRIGPGTITERCTAIFARCVLGSDQHLELSAAETRVLQIKGKNS